MDGYTFKRHVLNGRKEVDQIFMECHLIAGRHRGGDEARYYRPNYYKEDKSAISVEKGIFKLY